MKTTFSLLFYLKKGDVKPGEQMHIQIIVSRKDESNSIKLSPLNNSKWTNTPFFYAIW